MNDQDWRRLQMTTIYKFDKVEQHKNRWKVTGGEKDDYGRRRLIRIANEWKTLGSQWINRIEEILKRTGNERLEMSVLNHWKLVLDAQTVTLLLKFRVALRVRSKSEKYFCNFVFCFSSRVSEQKILCEWNKSPRGFNFSPLAVRFLFRAHFALHRLQNHCGEETIRLISFVVSARNQRRKTD